MLHLIVAAIFLLSPFFVQPAYSQDQLQLKEYACLASNPQTFKDCLQEAKDTGVPLIKITKPIICGNRQDCSFELIGSGRSFQISPSGPENKFIRRGDFSYTLLNIESSSNMTLKDLTFEDEGTAPCPAGTICPPLITIKNSSSRN